MIRDWGLGKSKQKIMEGYPNQSKFCPNSPVPSTQSPVPSTQSMDLQLTGKIVLVTAASKGLGKATARQFAREGAKVAICARSELVDKAAAEIENETGTEVLAVRADVTQQADIERVINATVDKFGGLDILVTNAGGPLLALLMRLI